MAGKLPTVDDQGNVVHIPAPPSVETAVGDSPIIEGGLASGGHRIDQPISHTVIQVHVRATDRVVEQWTTTQYAPHDLHVQRDEDGAVIEVTPKFPGGAGDRDGCVVEEIDLPTLGAILAAMPEHGGGVVLSEDHSSVTPAPEPGGYWTMLAAQQQRTDDLALLASSDDPRHQAMARLLGGG